MQTQNKLSPSKHLVLVLGMHRSGTSAITRGISALGVELGSNLLGPMAGVNEKGFFEDSDFVQLNESLLSALSASWHSVSPLRFSLDNSSELLRLTESGIAALADKFQKFELFGLKDPRFSVLLPIWQTIFDRLNLKVSYILSLRSPENVSESLLKRDSFPAVKSDLLWLHYMLQALSDARGRNLLVVNYDRVMENPLHELERMARFLNVQFDSSSPEINHYCSEFLDNSLRHWKGSNKERRPFPELTEQLHQFLLPLAELDGGVPWVEIDADLKKFLVEREDLISLLSCVDGLSRETDEVREKLKIVTEETETLDRELIHSRNQITELLETKRGLSDKIADRENKIAQAYELYEQSRFELHQLYSSKSWKVTQPLRMITNWIRPASAIQQSNAIEPFTGAAKLEKLEFVFLVESGRLEEQSLILAESVRRFTGDYCETAITAISPRSEKRPARSTIDAFNQLHVSYLPLDLKSPCPSYVTSYRVLAASYLEQHSSSDFLAVLDTDTLFVARPEIYLGDADIAARPVDVHGMCTSGPEDPNDLYWRKLCQCCRVPYEKIPFLMTTVDKVRVKASYNGGFVVAKRSAGLFQSAEENLRKANEIDLRPWAGRDFSFVAGHGVVSGEGAQHWGSAQACLSIAIWGSNRKFKMLPASHNFPLNALMQLDQTEIPEKLVHIHYHHLLGRLGSGEFNTLGFSRDVSEFLRTRSSRMETHLSTERLEVSSLRSGAVGAS